MTKSSPREYDRSTEDPPRKEKVRVIVFNRQIDNYLVVANWENDCLQKINEYK
jgi:hypothetical protein